MSEYYLNRTERTLKLTNLQRKKLFLQVTTGAEVTEEKIQEVEEMLFLVGSMKVGEK